MSSRRGFIKSIFHTMMPLLGKLGTGVCIDNPYASVDWKRHRQIVSTSHIHIPDQESLDSACRNMKLQHVPVSNYYPSTPYYPMDSIREGQFRLRQDFGVMYSRSEMPDKRRWTEGRFLDGPLEWNRIITDSTGWYSALPKALQKELPFRLGGPAFPRIPADVIFSPNAEHHTFTNSSLHANSLGSFYSSGSFDARNKFLSSQNGYCNGTGRPWQAVFKDMIEHLQFSDGGGVTLNHPVWSKLPFDELCAMLDFDDRVLGIEVYNDTCETSTRTPQRGWATDVWDALLRTGRKCLGFFVPDHTLKRGRNILLVPDFTEHACLRAYRTGAFYGAINGSGLGFTYIALKDKILTVEVNAPCTISVTTDLDRVERKNGRRKQFSIPVNDSNRPTVKYVRIEAKDDSGEQIFSQPIIFRS